MPRADMFPRHDRLRALGTEALLRMTQLIGPRCRCVQLPVVRALVALRPECPQAAVMVPPAAELADAPQRSLASPAENRSAETTLALAVFLQVPIAEDQ